MTITLPPELASIVQQHLDSGKYDDPTEVLSEALELLEHREQSVSELCETLRQNLLDMINRLERGAVE